jgi:hypothetical protein
MVQWMAVERGVIGVGAGVVRREVDWGSAEVSDLLRRPSARRIVAKSREERCTMGKHVPNDPA